jgi:two-component system sensor histidine kinase RstB
VVAGDYGALDMRLMERVLDNLVNNALRYSNSGFRSA